MAAHRRTRLSDPRHKPTTDEAYQEYLQSPEWRATREWALERANRKCQVCASATMLDVHHNTYERRGHEWPSDLVVLCRECHTLFHGRMGNVKPKRMKLSDYTKPAPSSPEMEELERQSDALRAMLRKESYPHRQVEILREIQSLERLKGRCKTGVERVPWTAERDS